MATAGQGIKKANFSTSWAREWMDGHGNNGQVRYVYICAAAWYMRGYSSYYIFGGSGRWEAYVSYYTGSGWSSETALSISGADGTVTKHYAHHWSGQSLSASFHSNYPIWRIRYYPTRANSRWDIWIWAGGWGVADRNYPTGKFIRSRGIAGKSECIYYAGTTNNPSYVINERFNPNNRRGSPILASDDSELNYFPYMG